MLSVVLVSACASGPRAVNVAAVRSEINGTIRSEQNDRSVMSMGKTEETRAVVYTTNKKTGERQEETWVKDGSHWKLESSTKIAQTSR